MLVAAALVLGQCNLPRCTTLQTTGGWSGETFEPSASPACYYGVPTNLETLDLLAGSWFFMAGGSNLWVTYQSLGNQAVPAVYGFNAERGMHTPDFTDLILERRADGTYQQTHFSYQPVGAGNSDFDGPVPEFQNESVRITFYAAKLWPNVSTGMTRMQRAANGWEGARAIVFAQAGYWYETNYDLQGYADAHLPELAAFLSTHQAACMAAGACFLASVSCIELDWYNNNPNRKCNAFDRRFKSEVQGQIGPGAASASAFTFFEIDKFVSQRFLECAWLRDSNPQFADFA